MSIENRSTATQGRHRGKAKGRLKVCRNKYSDFWCWFIKVGSKEFREKYGRNYDETDENDRHLIGQLWILVKGSYDQNSQQKFNGNYTPQSVGNVEITKSLRTLRGPSHSSPYRSTSFQNCPPISCVVSDFSNVVLQFLEVLPYPVISPVNGHVLICPAEIAVTNFTLANGPTFHSEIIHFDRNLSYDCSSSYYEKNNFYFWDQDTIRQNAVLVNVLIKQARGKTPQDMWRTLIRNRNSCEITVCDARNILVVERALLFLASTAGVDQQPTYNEIMDTMVTAQDLVIALSSHYSDVAGMCVSNYLSREKMDREFEKPRTTSICCHYHENTILCHKSRQFCPVAKTAILIDAFYSLCFSANVDDFRTKYRAQIHRFTDIDSDEDTPHTTLSKFAQFFHISSRCFLQRVLQLSRSRECSSDFDQTENIETEREYSQQNIFVFRYTVVSIESSPFVRRRKVEIDLKDAISRLLDTPTRFDQFD
ncbi:hypothetical protein DICVIV_04438 [Dictyocaulus viviparus]|uniref:Maelstrom domain-containing protein n=1 Tax=Dictyocaulus viviparus TaxID=29172 RepID=A0A0D8XXP2_DICVI|nr:hypothetical protein DICVIV_04438 [Dictyocaulus viviparus]